MCATRKRANDHGASRRSCERPSSTRVRARSLRSTRGRRCRHLLLDRWTDGAYSTRAAVIYFATRGNFDGNRLLPMESYDCRRSSSRLAVITARSCLRCYRSLRSCVSDVEDWPPSRSCGRYCPTSAPGPQTWLDFRPVSSDRVPDSLPECAMIIGQRSYDALQVVETRVEHRAGATLHHAPMNIARGAPLTPPSWVGVTRRSDRINRGRPARCSCRAARTK
jgi:hypothetical protein